MCFLFHCILEALLIQHQLIDLLVYQLIDVSFLLLLNKCVQQLYNLRAENGNILQFSMDSR